MFQYNQFLSTNRCKVKFAWSHDYHHLSMRRRHVIDSTSILKFKSCSFQTLDALFKFLSDNNDVFNLLPECQLLLSGKSMDDIRCVRKIHMHSSPSSLHSRRFFLVGQANFFSHAFLLSINSIHAI